MNTNDSFDFMVGDSVKYIGANTGSFYFGFIADLRNKDEYFFSLYVYKSNYRVVKNRVQEFVLAKRNIYPCRMVLFEKKIKRL